MLIFRAWATCGNSHVKNPVFMNKTQSFVRRLHSVAWKPIMHLTSLLWMTSRRTPTKLDRFIARRKSRWPCDACVVHARFARRDYKPRGSALCEELMLSLGQKLGSFKTPLLITELFTNTRTLKFKSRLHKCVFLCRQS